MRVFNLFFVFLRGVLDILAQLWFKGLQGTHFQAETKIALPHGHA